MVLTGVRLDTSRNFTGTDVIEVGDILAKNGLKIAFAKTFGVNLSGIHPTIHVNESCEQHSNT